MSRSGRPSSGARRGEHAIDRLIRQLADDPRALPTDEQIRQIARRVASAPFNPQFADMLPVADADYLGRPIAARGPSLFQHLVKRVLINQQWVYGTTADQLLDDFRRTATAPSSRFGVSKRGPASTLIVQAATDQVVSTAHRGPQAGPHILVFYSANRGMIVSGYQVDDVTLVAVTRHVRWLT